MTTRINQAIKSLPFGAYLVASVSDGAGNTFIVVARDTAHDPFVCYRIGTLADCQHGHYCQTRSQAIRSMMERAGYLNCVTAVQGIGTLFKWQHYN